MNRFSLLTLGLFGVFLLSACTPATTTPAPAEPAQLPEPSSAPTAEISAPAVLTEEALSPNAEPIVVIPTSRGNQLEATDPTTVNIASGEPQLIEFFAFW